MTGRIERTINGRKDLAPGLFKFWDRVKTIGGKSYEVTLFRFYKVPNKKRVMHAGNHLGQALCGAVIHDRLTDRGNDVTCPHCLIAAVKMQGKGFFLKMFKGSPFITGKIKD